MDEAKQTNIRVITKTQNEAEVLTVYVHIVHFYVREGVVDKSNANEEREMSQGMSKGERKKKTD